MLRRGSCQSMVRQPMAKTPSKVILLSRCQGRMRTRETNATKPMVTPISRIRAMTFMDLGIGVGPDAVVTGPESSQAVRT
jgi:hypothetical protein